MVYAATLIAHSWIRWVVLLAAVVAVLRAVRGWNGTRPWTPADDRAGRFLATALDLQLLFGLLLYFLVSPFMDIVRAHLSTAMRDDAMRFWLIEHPVGMVLAMVLAHVGRARIRKAVDPRRKHRLAAIFFGLALVVLAASVPWPGRTTGRPLWRMPAGEIGEASRPELRLEMLAGVGADDDLVRERLPRDRLAP